MAQNPKKKEKLPPNVRDLTDAEIIEKVFSKTVKKALLREAEKAGRKDVKPK